MRLPNYVVTFALHDPAVLLKVLPLDYDPDIIADYWGRRPVAVATRVVQLLGIAGGFLGGLALDFVQNRTQQNEVWLLHRWFKAHPQHPMQVSMSYCCVHNLRPHWLQVKRAIQLRNIMTSLGPAYIKLGQALSIRPDLLSPAAMNELQKLCDKVRSALNSCIVPQHSQGGWHCLQYLAHLQFGMGSVGRQ